MAYALTRLKDVEGLPAGGGGLWHPLRRALGVTAFGLNAYSAAKAGEPLIERHDERSPGAGGHEEVYLVGAGRARFTVDGERVDVAAGGLLRVDPGTTREAVATADGTLVLVIGGRPGAGLPVSPFEHWYAAEPAHQAGDFHAAIETVAAGLADHPHNPGLHYQLACFHALAGQRDWALHHLREAYAADPRTRDWAAGDDDLAGVRDDPSLRPG